MIQFYVKVVLHGIVFLQRTAISRPQANMEFVSQGIIVT